jgi:hypothetical protein
LLASVTNVTNFFFLSSFFAESFYSSPTNAASFSVKTGSTMKSGKGAGSNVQSAAKLVTHAHYNAELIQFDVALVKLSTPLQYSDVIRPVCLHDRPSTSEFRECYTTGWGRDIHGNLMIQILY